jgi:hypothetical protein
VGRVKGQREGGWEQGFIEGSKVDYGRGGRMVYSRWKAVQGTG